MKITVDTNILNKNEIHNSFNKFFQMLRIMTLQDFLDLFTD